MRKSMPLPKSRKASKQKQNTKEPKLPSPKRLGLNAGHGQQTSVLTIQPLNQTLHTTGVTVMLVNVLKPRTELNANPGLPIPYNESVHVSLIIKGYSPLLSGHSR